MTEIDELLRRTRGFFYTARENFHQLPRGAVNAAAVQRPHR
jgi:hypothetical protein